MKTNVETFKGWVKFLETETETMIKLYTKENTRNKQIITADLNRYNRITTMLNEIIKREEKCDSTEKPSTSTNGENLDTTKTQGDLITELSEQKKEQNETKDLNKK